MLARIRKAQEENEGGFTLIELLVVMIIIGILAAIAIPVFLNQRKKAQDSAAKADVSTIGKEIATYFVDGTVAPGSVAIQTAATPAPTLNHYILAVPAGTAPATPVISQDIGKASANNVVPSASQFFTDSSNWCVTVTNPKGDKSATGYKYSAAGGLAEGACTSAAG